MATSVNFPATPKQGWALILTANTATDGTGTVSTLYTAGSGGGYVKRLICNAKGTNVQTQLKIFSNNGSDNATGTNNSMIENKTLPAVSAYDNASEVPRIEIPIEMTMPAGYKLNVCIGTTVANGWHIVAECSDF